ncbi:hypothetical protein NDU88_006891 [Pleurodeles waltl]|uniref:Uncharacterized protein n=1 Tax=Pleurodeles waltl TaxID=8319 RepID=A0AAV7UN25_PLEWA|nr:hypothetical protein NDU88_006891 [Pleurodeles waltl]
MPTRPFEPGPAGHQNAAGRAALTSGTERLHYPVGGGVDNSSEDASAQCSLTALHGRDKSPRKDAGGGEKPAGRRRLDQ